MPNSLGSQSFTSTLTDPRLLQEVGDLA